MTDVSFDRILSQEAAAWQKLIRRANKNKKYFKDKIVEIEIARILKIGRFMYHQPDSAIVEDVEGRVWEIPETSPGGLVSRWNVQEKMKFKIAVSKEGIVRAYPIPARDGNGHLI